MNNVLETNEFEIPESAKRASVPKDMFRARHLIREFQNEPLFKLLDNSSFDLEGYDDYGNTLALIAAFNGNDAALRYLIDKGVNIFKQNRDMIKTMSCFASRHLSTFRLVNSMIGFDPNESSEDGVSPIQNCLQNLVTRNLVFGHVEKYNLDLVPEKIEIIRLLVEMGANINHANDYGRTVMHNACYSGSLELVTFLISVGAKVDVIDNHGKLPADHSPSAELKEVFNKLFVSKSSH
ncbi:TPA: ankyrin repeat domain-containing protein [Vibrio cholerae]|nr:ankyrin repeat domain-containing protein [Vibrio cholerae]